MYRSVRKRFWQGLKKLMHSKKPADAGQHLTRLLLANTFHNLQHHVDILRSFIYWEMFDVSLAAVAMLINQSELAEHRIVFRLRWLMRGKHNLQIDSVTPLKY